MKERPILFSGPMVRAILEGLKTQTRRAVKITHRTPGLAACLQTPGFEPRPRLAAELCPYGAPGDRLWVREAWDFIPDGDPGAPNCAEIVYWADARSEPRSPPSDFNPMIYGREKVRPSIHMPRWASRITLEITDVRVQWVQDINRGDAMDEGCPFPNMAAGPDPRQWYADLWRQINGAGSWDANPWVWAITFRRAA